jgi:hypothetical protein
MSSKITIVNRRRNPVPVGAKGIMVLPGVPTEVEDDERVRVQIFRGTIALVATGSDSQTTKRATKETTSALETETVIEETVVAEEKADAPADEAIEDSAPQEIEEPVAVEGGDEVPTPARKTSKSKEG